MPEVTVILPTYNRADLLRRSAGSVLAQTFRDLELIVVDDGSTDDIAGAVQALGDPRVRCLRRDVRGGPAAARNTALKDARGTYVAFQDSDDEWLLDKLDLQMAATDGAHSMVLCGLLRRLGSRLRPYAPGGRKAAELDFADVAGHPITYTQTWLVPREAVIAAGGFDERLRVWEDWELLLRLAGRLRIRSVGMPLVLSEQAMDSVTHDNAAFLDAMALVLDKHGAALARMPRQRAALRHVQARLQINAGCMREARRLLINAVADDPRRLKSWGMLAATAFGRGFVTGRLRQATVRAVETGR